MSIRTIILFLVALSSAWGACGNPSTHVFTCSTISDLQDFMLAQPFACGDEIILDVATFRVPDAYADPYVPLPRQTGCNGKYTWIHGPRDWEIPPVNELNKGTYRPIMPLLETSNNAIWHYGYNGGGANNYRISGIRMSDSDYAVANRLRVPNLFLGGADLTTDALMQQYISENIIIERCIIENRANYVYGDPNTSQTDGNAFVTAIALGISTPMRNFIIRDSYVKLDGWTQNAEAGGTDWVNITGGTAASPAQITGTGVQAALGITNSGACDAVSPPIKLWVDDSNVCHGHARRVVIRGATGSWATLNGYRYVRARSDGGLDVILPDPARGSYSPTNLDASGFGSFTGSSPQVAGVGLLTQYAIGLTTAYNVKILGNSLESYAMPVFFGGGFNPQIDPATIQSGSTGTSLILDHVRGLSVGMLVMFRVPAGSSHSTYCHDSTAGCWSIDTSRVGRVTAISGITVTLEPYGVNGTDTAVPDVGKAAWWKNHRVEGVEVRGNTFSLGHLHASADAGKGNIEMKQCHYCLIQGNDMSANVGGSYFTELKGQGESPNNSVHDVAFTHNLNSGLLGDGSVSCGYRTALDFTDYENSVANGYNGKFRHNVHVGCATVTGQNYSQIEVLGTKGGSEYSHNTYAPAMGATTRFAVHGGCTPYADPFYPELNSSNGVAVKDNIVGYGGGEAVTSGCWTGYPASVTTNIIVDTQSVGTSAINSSLPGNFPVADYTGSFWAGTCDYINWATGCKLHASNANRGAASDGGDPGADMDEVVDRMNRWSEKSGLLRMDYGVIDLTRNEGAFVRGSTKTAITFTLFASTPSTCTIQIFTNRNRATAHGDTSSPVACNRSGSFSNGNTVTFVAGTASALTASTTYFYKITDGTHVMVGEFPTRAAGSGTYQWPLRTGTSQTLRYCTNVDLATGCTDVSAATSFMVPVATGTAVYWRLGGIGEHVFVAR